MQPARQDLPVIPGTTYRDIVRIMQPDFEYRDIAGILGAPVVLTVPGHGLESDWPVWVRGVTGMPDLNREPGKQHPHRARRIDDGTLEFNAQSAAGLKPTGGQVIYRRPMDLSDATAVMKVLRGAEVVLSLAVGEGITLTAPGTYSRQLTAEQTLLLIGEDLTYTFEVVFSGGVVTRYLEGAIT